MENKLKHPLHTIMQGVFFCMCRKNQLCGSALVAFGLGLLVGMVLNSGFVSFLIGLGIIGLGCWCMSKK